MQNCKTNKKFDHVSNLHPQPDFQHSKNCGDRNIVLLILFADQIFSYVVHKSRTSEEMNGPSI